MLLIFVIIYVTNENNNTLIYPHHLNLLPLTDIKTVLKQSSFKVYTLLDSC